MGHCQRQMCSMHYMTEHVLSGKSCNETIRMRNRRRGKSGRTTKHRPSVTHTQTHTRKHTHTRTNKNTATYSHIHAHTCKNTNTLSHHAELSSPVVFWSLPPLPPLQ